MYGMNALRKEMPESSLSPLMSCEDTAKRCSSMKTKVGSCQTSNLLVP